MADWERTLETLVRDRGPALVRYAYLLTGDVAAAEDLVQDAVVATFVRRGQLRETQAAESYVRRAVLTTFVDGTRRVRRFRDVRHLLVRSDVHEGPERGVQERADVVAALADLPPRVRACVVLRFYEDLTINEIARELDLSDGAVKRYLSDGTRTLERRLGPVQDDVETHVVGGQPGRAR